MSAAHYITWNAPFGKIFAASSPKGLLRIALSATQAAFSAALAELGFRPVPGEDALLRRLSGELNRYFQGESIQFEYPLDLRRQTPFQRKVLEAIRKIPYGTTRSYGEIAAAVGSPGACRAVGAVAAKNPFPLVIPCHRVVGADGRLVGFSSGLPLKERLLRLEGALSD
jgi:methylated-DNA-[protein]-cysteine S-methyltransferase